MTELPGTSATALRRHPPSHRFLVQLIHESRDTRQVHRHIGSLMFYATRSFILVSNPLFFKPRIRISYLVLWLPKGLNNRWPVQIPVKVKSGKSNQCDLFRQLPNAVRWRFFDLTDEVIQASLRASFYDRSRNIACQTSVSTLPFPGTIFRHNKHRAPKHWEHGT